MKPLTGLTSAIFLSTAGSSSDSSAPLLLHVPPTPTLAEKSTGYGTASVGDFLLRLVSRNQIGTTLALISKACGNRAKF
jgi:hypothetical protein